MFIGERKPAARAGEPATSDASGNESSERSQIVVLGNVSFYPLPVLIVALCSFRSSVFLDRKSVV